MNNNLFAINTLSDRQDTDQPVSPLHTNDTSNSFHNVIDTIINGQNDIPRKLVENSIPAELLKTSINFQINSFIYYLNIQHFVNDNAKKSFVEGWLKEKKLNRLSIHTDSLRKEYATVSDEQKEKVAAQIIQSEQESLSLNEQMKVNYEKAREEENNYWQSASMDDITKFQQEVRKFEDSIAKRNQQAVLSTVPDTITLYLPQNDKAPEPAVAVPTGIIYKIQIGAYKGKIPETANKLIKKISLIRKVENNVDDNGVKVYTTGNLKTYAEAETMLAQVKQEGIKNAVITAYQNGKKITVPEARKLNKEL